MEWEAMASRWVTELEHELESVCHESKDWATEATEARAVEVLVAEWVTAAERGLEAVKAC